MVSNGAVARCNVRINGSAHNELRKLIHFEDGYFEFGTDWINYYGKRT
jgi:hypothetical protein